MEKDSSLQRMELLEFAHDLRNLLVPALGSIELLIESGELSQDQKTRLNVVLRQIDRITRLVEDVLWLGHEAGSHHPVDVGRLVKEVSERVETDCRVGVRCIFLAHDSLYVAGSEPRLWRAVYNLVLNAAEAAGKSGDVVVRVLLGSMPETVEIEVEDSGPGIPAGVREKIFDPSFTSKFYHRGLGLCLAKQVIEKHKGSLRIESGSRRGTILKVALPLLSG